MIAYTTLTDLYEDEIRWIKGQTYKRVIGQEIVACCFTGGIMIVFPNDYLSVMILAESIVATSLTDWNDHPDRTISHIRELAYEIDSTLERRRLDASL